MISHKHKFIFIFQHKCAGTTLKSVLEKHDAWNLEFHLGVKSYEYNDYDLEKYKDYFIFAVKRNPYDRVVSGWKYLQNDLPSNVKRTLKRGLSFKDTLLNLPQKGHDYHHITQLQTENLINQDGKLICNMLLRFENLQKDFDIVCKKIGLPSQKLPHLQKSEHKHYTEYYDDEARQIVAEKYAKDIEYFGYKFGE